MVFFVIFDKTQAILVNLVHGLLSKFAARLCKHFPPHLNDVSTLPCESWKLECSSRTCYINELLKKFSPEIILTVYNCGLQIRHI